MQSKWIRRVVSVLIPFAAALLCTGILYYFFPSLICHTVYMVEEYGTDAMDEYPMQEKEIIERTFTPSGNYLKAVGIHVALEGAANDEKWEGLTTKAQLYQGDRRVAEGKESVTSNGFVEVPIEKWVDSGKAYRVVFSFETDKAINLKMGADGIYMQSIYGSYSRKLLVLWFLAFWCIAGFFWQDGDRGM